MLGIHLKDNKALRKGKIKLKQLAGDGVSNEH